MRWPIKRKLRQERKFELENIPDGLEVHWESLDELYRAAETNLQAERELRNRDPLQPLLNICLPLTFLHLGEDRLKRGFPNNTFGIKPALEDFESLEGYFNRYKLARLRNILSVTSGVGVVAMTLWGLLPLAFFSLTDTPLPAWAIKHLSHCVYPTLILLALALLTWRMTPSRKLKIEELSTVHYELLKVGQWWIAVGAAILALTKYFSMRGEPNQPLFQTLGFSFGLILIFTTIVSRLSRKQTVALSFWMLGLLLYARIHNVRGASRALVPLEITSLIITCLLCIYMAYGNSRQVRTEWVRARTNSILMRISALTKFTDDESRNLEQPIAEGLSN